MMHLSVNRFSVDGTPSEATMEHGGKVISWNIALFDRMSISGGYDIFEHINGYWKYLHPSVQDKIFVVYTNIREAYDSIWDQTQLTSRLFVLVAELFTLHELADVHHWIWFHSNALLPDNLRDTYKESHETPGTRERTYLKDDYKWLVSLSVALRVMIPVWGEYISKTKRNNTVLKEYFAFHLLTHTNLIKSEPMERLRVYVEHSLPMDKTRSSAILGGISSEEFPIWVLGLVAVRRLSIGDVRGVEASSSLVTFIYKYIGQKVKSHDNSFIGMVKDKTNEGQTAEGENNLSKLEGYKVKQEIPAGDIAIISYYLKDTNNLALKICADIDLNIVNDTLRNVKVLESKQIWNPQIVLTQWVLKKIIPPKGLLHVSKMQVLQSIAVAQALLWHRKHYELAVLISAVEQTNVNELSVGGTDSRARITKEQLEQLDVLYPYARKPVGKQKIMKHINPAVDAIESIAGMLNQHDWILTAPEYMVSKITGGISTRYAIPYNIKVLLADLAIELGNRTFK